MMDKNAKIFVAGHRGLVGSALCKSLTEAGYTNLILKTRSELPLDRQSEVERFFESEGIDYVFLAAAKVGGIYANNTYKAEFIYDNMVIAANVIHSAFKFGVKKLLNLGSSCIYPKFAKQPMDESELLTGSLEPTNEPYAIAKISAIKLCRYYNEQYGTNFISLMPTNLYGPHDRFDFLNSHVLPALLRKIHLSKLLSEGRLDLVRKDLCTHDGRGFEGFTDAELKAHLLKYNVRENATEIWGSGMPYREFLYVEDLADACLYLMNHKDSDQIGEFVNVGTGEDITIKELAYSIKETVGFQGDLVFDPSKPDGTPKKLLNVSRLSALGWKAQTKLPKGLQKTYEWYQSLY